MCAIGVFFDMVIKETSVFTKQVQKLLDKESYRLLQLRLVAEPDAGDLLRGTGGLRKIRWEGSGRGKRGGVRVIYYWAQKQDVMLLLLMYGKAQQDDLTPKQKAVLKKLIQEEYP
jgi:mRNA-degrading endonuclease RelE of RelBE toxin-antitoxin system